jgi:hypothetical protein
VTRAALTGERRTPEAASGRRRDLDGKVEDLARRLAEVVNGAEPEQRSDLRAYALELLRESTEVGDVPAPKPASAKTNASGTNPIGIALLLGVLGLPAVLLFPPVGLTLLAFAAVMGIWGVLAVLLRRST